MLVPLVLLVQCTTAVWRNVSEEMTDQKRRASRPMGISHHAAGAACLLTLKPAGAAGFDIKDSPDTQTTFTETLDHCSESFMSSGSCWSSPEVQHSSQCPPVEPLCGHNGFMYFFVVYRTLHGKLPGSSAVLRYFMVKLSLLDITGFL